jgi:hypothetical protein
VIDLLYKQWIEVDRHIPGMDEWNERGETPNLQLAIALSDRPEARAVLEDYVTRPGGWSTISAIWPIHASPETVEHVLRKHGPALADLPLPYQNPTRRAPARVGLLVEVLARHYGVDELLLHCEAEIRRNVRVRKGPLSLRSVTLILGHLLDPAAEELLVSLMTCPDLGYLVGSQLQHLWWYRLLNVDRAAAFEQARRFVEGPERNHRRVREALYHAGLHPTAKSRDLLWWSLAQDDYPEYAFAGIVGLEALKENGPEWHAKLTKLTTSPAVPVQLLACAALVRRGDTRYLHPIETAARTFPTEALDRPGDYRQGLAIRLLGELAASKHLTLLKAIVAQTFRSQDNGSPEQEAAFVLAQQATPETVTTLLRAYFTESCYLRRAIREYLPAVVSHLEGEEVPLINRIDLWRYSRIPP